jgi:hypothetical protein
MSAAGQKNVASGGQNTYTSDINRGYQLTHLNRRQIS